MKNNAPLEEASKKKFCKDCKHFDPAMATKAGPRQASCLHPNNQSLVDAQPTYRPIALRESMASMMCGPSGRWWEQ